MYRLVEFLDQEQILYFELDRTDMILQTSFLCIYFDLCGGTGSTKGFSKHFMKTPNCTDRMTKEFIFGLTMIPFDYSRLPKEYYYFLKELSENYLVLHNRFNSLEDLLKSQDELNKIKLN